MKIFHLSDLHLGKIVNGYSMEEDQEYVFSQIYDYVDSEKPDVVIIAGDIYDKVIPSVRAVEAFDRLITTFAKKEVQVLIISGNHDSAERLEFGAKLMEKNKIYIESKFSGKCRKITFNDKYGPVNFYLLPFFKPSDVKAYYQIAENEKLDYNLGVEKVLKSETNFNIKERNILVAHQNVTNSGNNIKSDSETINIGTVDNIEANLFDNFDYVALGHLHSPQEIKRPQIRYSGSPVIYSMSEAKNQKSLVVVEFKDTKNPDITFLPLKQKSQWYEFKGSMEEAMRHPKNSDYAKIVLTDKNTIIDALPRLRSVYQRLMSMEFDGENFFGDLGQRGEEQVKDKTPEELFAEFYKFQKGEDISKEDFQLVKEIADEGRKSL